MVAVVAWTEPPALRNTIATDQIFSLLKGSGEANVPSSLCTIRKLLLATLLRPSNMYPVNSPSKVLSILFRQSLLFLH